MYHLLLGTREDIRNKLQYIHMHTHLGVGDVQGESMLHNEQGLPFLNPVVPQGEGLAMPHCLQWPVLELQLVVSEVPVDLIPHQLQQTAHLVPLDTGREEDRHEHMM